METPKIERRKVITVAHAQLNDYGDLLVTDTENNEHKIGKKRAQLHELFQTDAVIELGYASYMNREYIAVAHPSEGVPPKPSSAAPPKETPKPSDKMSKDDWAEKDRSTKESIEKQVWIKELGLCIREKNIDIAQPLGKFLRTWYYKKMMDALGLEFKEEGQ